MEVDTAAQENTGVPSVFFTLDRESVRNWNRGTKDIYIMTALATYANPDDLDKGVIPDAVKRKVEDDLNAIELQLPLLQQKLNPQHQLQQRLERLYPKKVTSGMPYGFSQLCHLHLRRNYRPIAVTAGEHACSLQCLEKRSFYNEISGRIVLDSDRTLEYVLARVTLRISDSEKDRIDFVRYDIKKQGADVEIPAQRQLVDAILQELEMYIQSQFPELYGNQ